MILHIKIYSNIVNIRDFQDFANVNIKWLCFCEDIECKNCCVHLFQMMTNEILSCSNCEKWSGILIAFVMNIIVIFLSCIIYILEF